jgi:hypothetical protein
LLLELREHRSLVMSKGRRKHLLRRVLRILRLLLREIGWGPGCLDGGCSGWNPLEPTPPWTKTAG